MEDVIVKYRLPHSPESEKTVIGYLLDNQDASYIDTISWELFLDDGHRFLADMLITERVTGKPSMSVGLIGERWQTHSPDTYFTTGGTAHLVSCQVTFKLSDMPYAIEQLTVCADRRKKIAAAEKFINTSANLTQVPDDFSLLESLSAPVGNKQTTFTVEEAFNSMVQEIGVKAANKLSGTPTGITKLDDKLLGLHPSQFIIVCGRPGTMKTGVALAFARTAAVEQGAVVYFKSLEMRKEELLQRLASYYSGVPVHQIRSGRLGEKDWYDLSEAHKKLAKSPLFIDDDPNLDIGKLNKDIFKFSQEYGAPAEIYIDYIQLMTGTSKGYNNRQGDVSEISRGLKILARTQASAVIGLCQLNRELEKRDNKRPTLSDLRESGCVSGDTLIALANGTMRPIASLVGKLPTVMAMTPGFRIVEAEVNGVWETGLKLTYHLITESGRTIKCSGNHPFYTAEGWKACEDLILGEPIAIARTLPIGSLSVGEAKYDEYMGNVADIRSPNGSLPLEVTELDEPSTCELLIRIWEKWGQSHCSQGGQDIYGITSQSPAVLVGISFMLSKLGIVSHMFLDTLLMSHKNERNMETLYTLRISDFLSRDIFVEKVAIHTRKHRLNAKRSRINKELNNAFLNKPADQSSEEYPAAFLTNRSTGYGDHDLIKEFICRRMLASRNDDKANQLRDCMDNRQVSWTRVSTIEAIGEQYLYDMEVADYHNFIGNGIVAHNSLEQDADIVVGLHSEDKFNPTTRDQGVTKLILLKHRAGELGEVPTATLAQYATIGNLEEAPT